MTLRIFALVPLVLIHPLADAPAGEKGPLRVAVFQVDITPPLGHPLSSVDRKPALRIDNPLSARGIVLMGDGRPVVLCAVDMVAIANESHDAWREALADAAGTTPRRVAVHVLHQHDAPRSDFTTAALLAKYGLAEKAFDVAYDRRIIKKTADAVRRAVRRPHRVTHIAVGRGRVDKVASNRRILGPDGKVKLMRWSHSTNPEAIAAPEGTIDPYVRLISFWDGDRPLASLTYYATHPQSYYGQGGVSADFVGLARALREQALPGVAHIHFNGASGNVAAGKYNDGSPKMRAVLARRLADGMKRAWDAARKIPISADQVHWAVRPVAIPLRDDIDDAQLVAVLEDERAPLGERVRAASHLAWRRRVETGRKIDLGCLRLGSAVYIVHLPGEPFVEYQLAAERMRPDATVCVAANGDAGPGYIGTRIAYTQGGYETSKEFARTVPQVEHVLISAMRELLRQHGSNEREEP